MDTYLLALDAGTGSIRAVLFPSKESKSALLSVNGNIEKTRAGQEVWILTGATTGSLPSLASKKF